MSLKLIRIAILVFAYVVASSCASYEEKSFFVGGNCEECGEIIEKAAKVKGVKSADWNYNTSLLTISFAPSILSEDEIQKNIASGGFDTRFYPADEEAKSKLPECCKEEVSRQLESLDPHLPKARGKE